VNSVHYLSKGIITEMFSTKALVIISEEVKENQDYCSVTRVKCSGKV